MARTAALKASAATKNAGDRVAVAVVAPAGESKVGPLAAMGDAASEMGLPAIWYFYEKTKRERERERDRERKKTEKERGRGGGGRRSKRNGNFFSQAV